MALFREELLQDVVERLRALADENRIRLLMRLREGQCNVTALAEELGIAQASVSKHLSVMRRVGIVDVDRQGNQAIYRVRDESVFDMCELVCGGVVRHLQAEHAARAETLKKTSTQQNRRNRK